MTTRVAPSPVFKRRADGNLEVEVPMTLAEAIGGAEIEVPTLRGTKRIRIPQGTQHGTVQRLRGEGPPKTELERAAATSSTGSGSRSRRSSTRKQREALEELSRTEDGAGPRERLLRDARRRGEDRSGESEKVGAS